MWILILADVILNPSTKYVTKYNNPAFITILNNPRDTKLIGIAISLTTGFKNIFTKLKIITAIDIVAMSHLRLTPGNITETKNSDIVFDARTLSGYLIFIIINSTLNLLA